MTERNQLTPKLIWIVVALIFLRLFCSLFFGNRWALFSQPEAADRLLKQKAPAVTEPEAPVALIKPDTAPVALPESAYSFDPTDVSFIELEDQAKREPDIEMLARRPSLPQKGILTKNTVAASAPQTKPATCWRLARSWLGF